MLSGIVFRTIERQFKDLIASNEAQIKQAYINNNDELSLRVGVSIGPDKERSWLTLVETTLTFVSEKVKASRVDAIDDKQQSLFEAAAPLVESIKKGEMSMAFTDGKEKKVVLEKRVLQKKPKC